MKTTFSDKLSLRRSLSVVRGLALAVLMLHVGQLVVPHVANAVQLVATGDGSEEEDELPLTAKKAADSSEEALLVAHHARPRFAGIRHVSAVDAAQDCAAPRPHAIALPGQASARSSHRAAQLVRLLI